MSLQDNYKTLLKKTERVIIYGTIGSLLGWDFETKMPPKGGKQRSMQFSTLATDMHKMVIDPEVGKLLKAIKEDENYSSSLSKEQQRNIFLIERDYNKATKLPTELVSEIARLQVVGIETWKKAKEAKDYSIFKPVLEKILGLQKKRAHYLDPDKDPYDVLLDTFEPNMDSSMITLLFDELKAGLVPLIKKIQVAKKQPDISNLRRTVPIELQEKLSEDLAKVVNYDLEKGRIDTTEHPFTTGYYNDVRITTHYFENEFDYSFFSVVHEAGHAIYEQNLSTDFIYQPIGQMASLGIHESQSRFLENIVCHSQEFWEYYFPRFNELTKGIFSDIDLKDFVHAINMVTPSKVRVSADEVTYSLHVIIRFEIERDLISGKLSLDELPAAWNQKYKEYLNVDIQDDSEGVLQDTHWAGGAFGYFPTYALGNIYNAHMLHVLRKDMPNYDDLVRAGDLKPIIDWMTEKVHLSSNLYDPADLMERITGES
ncbi:MAG: carboxypeptidase M32, partial [Candidatus Hodarchaeales archaeon]